jgi:hypothetical protein
MAFFFEGSTGYQMQADKFLKNSLVLKMGVLDQIPQISLGIGRVLNFFLFKMVLARWAKSYRRGGGGGGQN